MGSDRDCVWDVLLHRRAGGGPVIDGLFAAFMVAFIAGVIAERWINRATR